MGYFEGENTPHRNSGNSYHSDIAKGKNVDICG